MDSDASEVEAVDARPRRRLRKPSAKAQQSEENRCSLEAALLSSDDQNGGAAQPAVIDDAQTRKKGRRGVVEQTTAQTMQDQMQEQTSILKTLLGAWIKQEAYNKTLEAEVGLIKQELQAVKEIASQPLSPYRAALGCRMLMLYAPRRSVIQAM